MPISIDEVVAEVPAPEAPRNDARAQASQQAEPCACKEAVRTQREREERRQARLTAD